MLLYSLSKKPRVWRCGDYALSLGAKTYVMAILNATPDSFSGDGLARGGEINLKNAVENARRLIEEGADILDIGGESTRPGAQKISLEEETRRVLPLVEALAPLGVPLSIDTTKSEIAHRAVQSGASIINDISGGLADENMLRVLAAEKCGLILMHRRGDSQNMKWSEKVADRNQRAQAHIAIETENETANREKSTRALASANRENAISRSAATQRTLRHENLEAEADAKSGIAPKSAARKSARETMLRIAPPDSDKMRVLAAQPTTKIGDERAPQSDIIAEVLNFWCERLNATRAAGIDDARICLDAGFGFGKSVEENLEIVRRGGELSTFGFPTLSATSRKSTIARVLAKEAASESAPESDARLFGTAALTALAIAGGCDIVRVHDVKEMAQVAKICDATLRNSFA